MKNALRVRAGRTRSPSEARWRARALLVGAAGTALVAAVVTFSILAARDARRPSGAAIEFVPSTEPPTAATPPTTTTTPASTSASATTAGPTDTRGPRIRSISAAPPTVHEAGSAGCGDTTATVAVELSDPSAVDAAELRWSVGGRGGWATLTRGGRTWSALLGPFPDQTVALGRSAPVTVVVTAHDALGNASTASANPLTVVDCTFG